MNRSNLQTRAMQARDSLRNLGTKAAVAGTALVPGFAFASGGGGFDSASITAKITENSATAVVIIGAMILAVWGLRSMGLLKGRG